MTKRVYVDFESRSQCDIWQTGAWVYSAHPTTEVLCLCYAVDDSRIISANFHNGQPLDSLRAFFNSLVAEGAEFHAHNAYFERSIWKHKLEPLGFAPVPLRQWRCTAAKAAAHALPRTLEKCAEALECKNKKDMAGSRIMKFLSSSTGLIAVPDMERLIEYCRQDVAVEREIDQRLPDLCEREQRVWFLDQYINDTGVMIDREACQAAVACVNIETERLTEQLQLLTNEEVNAGTQTAAIKKYLESKGVSLPNMQKKTVTDAIKGADEGTKRVLELRQQLSLTSNAKYKSFLDVCSFDGRIRDTLVYHGASTGRWTGKLVQLQNLVKPSEEGFDNRGAINILKTGGYDSMSLFYGDTLLNTLSSCIRGMLIPTPGYEMFITDFAAIEARVVMWLAGEQVGIKMFEEGDADPTIPDIYVKMARDLFRNKTLVKKNKKERQVGKQTVLGGGFGMGAVKFFETCTKYSVDLGPATLRVERQGEEYMIPPLAQACIDGYRNTFKKVVQFWYDLEEGMKKAINGYPNQVGKVVCYVEEEFLRIKLPSGRTLAYHRPKISGNRINFLSADPLTKRYVPEAIWGGTAVENVTQAVARDLMADSMLQAASLGFRILFTVHDELVLEAVNGSKSEEDVLKIVRTAPTWAKGCPVNAECEKVERYKK